MSFSSNLGKHVNKLHKDNNIFYIKCQQRKERENSLSNGYFLVAYGQKTTPPSPFTQLFEICPYSARTAAWVSFWLSEFQNFPLQLSQIMFLDFNCIAIFFLSAFFKEGLSCCFVFTSYNYIIL